MPDVRPNVSYTVTLTAEEFRLVGLALAGRVKPGSKDGEAALTLNHHLQRVRVAYLKDVLHVAEGALAKVQEEFGPLPTEEKEDG